MKEAMCSPTLLPAKSQQKNAVPRQIVPSTDNICQEDFPKLFFKVLQITCIKALHEQ